MKVGIIGGGAAGFFAAIHVKHNYPDASVTIFEKSKQVLSKVKISGGGRCNVTNACSDINTLIKAYPRGGRQLRKLFHEFNTKHTINWFEERGVNLVTQADQCIFPKSQNSQTIIDCFLTEALSQNISIKTNTPVRKIIPINDKISLNFDDDLAIVFDKVIVATGGSPKLSGLNWLSELGHKIVPPLPSLFTFNMPKEPIRSLMGIVVENAITKIEGEKLEANGPLLITHWGMSGPAILLLSAYGARILADKNYNFKVLVNWTGNNNQNEVEAEFQELKTKNANKQLSTIKPYQLTSRLWHFLIDKLSINPSKKYSDLSKKEVNQLVNLLTNDSYEVSGKTTFKEEFVTAGGVCLSNVNMKTLESKQVKNLYFAGEVLDVDAITGGYNFQAAWTTGYKAAQLK